MGIERPRSACFVCNWAFGEEELATTATRKTFSNVSIVPISCIGRVDPVVILEALLKGMDGVLLVGCATPDCHFAEGNVYAELTINVLKKLLALARLEPRRLELYPVPIAEETRFSDVLTGFAKRLERLGPSLLTGEKCDAELFENMVAARNAAEDYALRAYIGKEKDLSSTANVYSERIPKEEFDALLDRVVETEFIRHRILLSTKKRPYSVRDLASSLNLKPATVLRHVLNMRRKGLIALDRYEGNTPLYKALEAQ